MMERLSTEIKRYNRYKKSFLAMFIDIDDFKSINDNYGHPIGDKVLIELTKILKKHSREDDVVGRMGGDEFLIILLETDLEKGKEFAIRLLDEIRLMIFDEGVKITVSIGVETYQGEESQAFITKVDKRLYEAKTCGKNKVI